MSAVDVDSSPAIERPVVGGAGAGTGSAVRLLWSPWTAVVFGVGLCIRLWIITTRQGNLIADEAYTGLQAAEVLDGRFRIIIPDLVYTAPFDSYVLAPATAVFGQNLFVLKLYPSLWWAASACFAVAIVRRIATDRAAVLAGAAVWLAPGALAIVATRGFQSYASGMAMVMATALAALVLLQSGNRAPLRPAPWRSALVGGLGGFAFYLHPMYSAALIPVLAVPAWQFRMCLRAWWAPAITAAVVANGPFLLWNARNGWPSLAQPAEATDSPLERLLRFFTGLVPRAYGMRRQSGEWVLGAVPSLVALLLLVIVVGVGAMLLWRRARPASMIVLAPLVAGWIIMAAFTNTAFVADGRYAIITFPFVACAVGVGADRLLPERRGATAAAICLWVALFSVPLLVRETGTEFVDSNAGFRSAVQLLEDRGIDRAIGYYWWVLPIEFLSDQRIRTAVTGNPDVVLLPDTQRLVQSAAPDQIAFVFWRLEEDTSRLLMPVERYDRTELGEVIIYTPISP